MFLIHPDYKLNMLTKKAGAFTHLAGMRPKISIKSQFKIE